MLKNDWERITPDNQIIKREHLINGKYLFVRIGKKNVVMLIFKDE